MSKAETLLKRLLVASKGVNTAERQAQARVKTNDYFAMDAKELKAAGLLEQVHEMAAEIRVLRDAASEASAATLVEVYDASLSVFTKWTDAKEAA